MRRCGLLVNFVELLDLVDVIGLCFKPQEPCGQYLRASALSIGSFISPPGRTWGLLFQAW
jgi:hypothetical protein